MQVVNFVMALSPILVVLVGILAFKQSAKRVAPAALVWTLVLGFTFFNVNGASFKETVNVFDALVWKGLKEGLKIVWMVFGAFVILNLLRETGAIEDVKATIARISDDRRVQAVIIGMMLPIFLEGAAGAGAPAAIAAPFLAALGFDPVTAIAMALLGDATPCSWGGAGLTTINGGAALVDAGVSTVALNSAMVGRFHMFGVLIIPFLLVFMAFGRKGFKGVVPYLAFAGITTCGVMFVLSNFVGAEVTSMGTGLISMLLSVVYVKTVKVQTPEEFRNHFSAQARKYSPFQRAFPVCVYPRAAAAGALWFPGRGEKRLCGDVYVWVYRLGGRGDHALRDSRRGDAESGLRSSMPPSAKRPITARNARAGYNEQPADRLLHHAVVPHGHDEPARLRHGRPWWAGFYPAAAVVDRRERVVHHRHRARLEHHVRRHAHAGRAGAGDEPDHRFRRAERGRVAGQPDLPEQHRRRLRDG